MRLPHPHRSRPALEGNRPQGPARDTDAQVGPQKRQTPLPGRLCGPRKPGDRRGLAPPAPRRQQGPNASAAPRGRPLARAGRAGTLPSRRQERREGPGPSGGEPGSATRGAHRPHQDRGRCDGADRSREGNGRRPRCPQRREDLHGRGRVVA